jgi:hypothetical protein
MPHTIVSFAEKATDDDNVAGPYITLVAVDNDAVNPVETKHYFNKDGSTISKSSLFALKIGKLLELLVDLTPVAGGGTSRNFDGDPHDEVASVIISGENNFQAVQNRCGPRFSKTQGCAEEAMPCGHGKKVLVINVD